MKRVTLFLSDRFTPHMNKKYVVFLFVVFIITWPSFSLAEKTGALNGTVSINGKKAITAVVFLQSKDKALTIEVTKNVIVQKNNEFDPTFLVVTAGSIISFENKDEITHNVRSKSKSNIFDIGQHFPSTSIEVTLKNPGHVKLECEFHPEMTMSIYVSPTQLAAVTDKNGDYEISDIPAGQYRLETWHPDLTEEEIMKNRIVVSFGGRMKTRDLEIKSKTDVKEDSGEEKPDWASFVNEIELGLNQALGRWKNKRMTSAAAKVMLVQAKFYVTSGLQEAITEELGMERAMEHDRIIDVIRKMVHGIDKEGQKESIIKLEIKTLMKGLKEDLKKIQ